MHTAGLFECASFGSLSHGIACIEEHLNTTVLSTALGGCVVSNGLLEIEALDFLNLSLGNALALEELGNSLGTLLGDALVNGERTRVVGVAIDGNVGIIVGLQHLGKLSQILLSVSTKG